jgi:nicotinamide mononucleotide transporter
MLVALYVWLLAPLVPWPSLPWLGMSPIEISAVAVSALCVWLYTRESVWAWPSGLLGVALYLVICYEYRLYADMGLQAVYIVLQIYGWRLWLRGGTQGSPLQITRTSARLWLILALIALAAYVPMGLALDAWTDTDVPWWDSAPTVSSLVAQYMISRKKLENWWVWVATDIVYIPLFAYKGLYLTAALYAVFIILCLIGLRAWTRTLRSSAAG